MLAFEIKNSQIVSINLRFNNIGDLGAMKLVLALTDGDITSLNLQGNRMSDSCVEKLLALGLNEGMLTLWFNGTYPVSENTTIDEVVVGKLASVLNDLTLTSNELENNNELKNSDHSLTIKNIINSDNSMIHEETITKSLKELLFEVNAGNYEDFKTYLIQRKKSLLRFDYNSREIPNFDFSHLMRAIKDTPVTSLCIMWYKLDAVRAGQLASELKYSQITTLDLGHNNLCKVGIGKLAATLKYSQLIRLELWYNKISYEGIRKFSSGIKGSKLRYLSLRNNHIDSMAVKELASVLKDSNLHILDLSHNRICSVGIKNLASELENSKITDLDISYNPIDDMKFLSPIGADGITVLCNAIPDSTIVRIIAVKSGLKSTGKYLIPSTVPISSKLTEAVYLNREKILLTPYYVTCLQYMPEESKAKYFDLPQLNRQPNKKEIIKYAGGIFMWLPQDMQNHILSFLPLMDSKKANNCQRLAKIYHSDGIQENQQIQNQNCSIM